MSILNVLKNSALTAGVATVLFAGAAEAASLFDGTITTGTPNEAIDIDVDFLDGFTPTTGNLQTITFDAEVGDTLTFEYNFSTAEATVAGSPFVDGGFYELNGEAVVLANSTDADSFTFETGVQTFELEIDTAGTNTLTFGAFNATSLTIPPFPGFPINEFDNGTSDLIISNVVLSSGPVNPTPVPEPASLLGLMAVAALGSRSLVKQKQS